MLHEKHKNYDFCKFTPMIIKSVSGIRLIKTKPPQSASTCFQSRKRNYSDDCIPICFSALGPRLPDPKCAICGEVLA